MMSSGALAAFDAMVALLSALEESRGDRSHGWIYTIAHTGEIVADLSGLMLTALATVVLCMAHQNPEGSGPGSGPLAGTHALVAVRTALEMMRNIDPMVDGDRADDMRARLEKYAEILQAAGGDGETPAAPKCGLGELKTALQEFISTHGRALGASYDDDL